MYDRCVFVGGVGVLGCFLFLRFHTKARRLECEESIKTLILKNRITRTRVRLVGEA